MAKAIQLIVGLGNPGPQYAATRHNVGFWFVDGLAQQAGEDFKAAARFHGAVAQAAVDGRRCWLLKPSTYVNHSGQAVQALLHFHKIPLDEVLVVHDDLDLPPGTVRVKFDGGHGGHNGLRHIIAVMGSGFHRLRIGIGHPGQRDKVTDFVLHAPSKAELAQIEGAMLDALAALPDIVAGRPDKAMQRLHTARE